MLSLGRHTADIGLDLGSTHLRVAVRGKGLVHEAPNLVAIQDGPQGRQAVALGEAAKRMVGRTTAGTRVVAPVRAGIIADFEAHEHALRDVLEQTGRARRVPNLLFAVPSHTTEVQRRALQEGGRALGAKQVHLVPMALAAALGAQLPVDAPVGSMVVDIGGGHSEATVTSLGGIVVQETVTLGGEAMDQRIVQWLRRNHDLMIGLPTAERIKLDIGAARPPHRHTQLRVRGRDIHTGAPKVLDMDGGHVAEAVADIIVSIRDVVLRVLADTPPELCADIHDSGVLLVGQGATLEGLDEVLSQATELPFVHAEAPGRCVARGLARLLEHDDLFQRYATP